MTDIAALKASAEKATRGKWSVWEASAGKKGPSLMVGLLHKRPIAHVLKSFGSSTAAETDAAYIALANPTSILSLIARLEALEAALREVGRRSSLLMHQNIGRWDMRVEHDKRSSDVTATNIEIIRDALEPTP